MSHPPCEFCGTDMVPHDWEKPGRFAKRRFCNPDCVKGMQSKMASEGKPWVSQRPKKQQGEAVRQYKKAVKRSTIAPKKCALAECGKIFSIKPKQNPRYFVEQMKYCSRKCAAIEHAKAIKGKTREEISGRTDEQRLHMRPKDLAPVNDTGDAAKNLMKHTAAQIDRIIGLMAIVDKQERRRARGQG
jgi:hypothetical protein